MKKKKPMRCWLLGAALGFAGAGASLSGAAASAPAGRYASDSDTVIDTATQLTWERQPSKATYTFRQAATHCASLEPQSAGWRVPTVKELLTLVDESRSMPAVDVKAFPKTESDFYWTSSPVAAGTSQAWAVSFRFGFDSSLDAGTPSFVRCVHGG